MTRRRVVAVTGATGFLGAHIAAALGTAGAELRLLTHHQSSHPLWPDVPIEIVTGSVTDPDACSRLVAGSDCVIHAAGLVKATRKSAFTEVNALGTANMAKAMRNAGFAGRFVLVSSLAAREPLISPYASSKRQGELAAQAAFADMPERLVILRPPPIYGPWDREALVLFKAASGKVAPVFGGGQVAIMHVRDTANAITQMAMGAGGAGCYALSGPDLEAYTIKELIQAAAQAVSGSPRLIPVPPPVLRAAGALSGWRARLRDVPDIFTADKAREYLHPDWTVSAQEALPFSIFQPAITLREGFQETADWYKAAGWL